MNMRRQSQSLSEEDEKDQSRMIIKKQFDSIPLLHESFDISSFAESKDSKNQISKYNQVFPTMNAPTLELHQSESNQNIRYFNKIQNQRQYIEDQTARNQQKNLKDKHQILLKEKIQQLKLTLGTKNVEIDKMNKKCDFLEQNCLKLQNQLRNRDEIIKEQKKQIQQIKQLKEETNQKNKYKNSSASSTYLDESVVNNFCPELLSPEETVILLNQLLKKVSKSTKMIKSLSSDETVKQILKKINQS